MNTILGKSTWVSLQGKRTRKYEVSKKEVKELWFGAE